MPLANTYRWRNVRTSIRMATRRSSQAMVVLESTWLFKNLTKLLMDMSTPNRWSGSGFSASPSPSGF